ncbi:MAG TPA: hypothetical protein VIH14_03915 [Anaerolineales bacterium]
MKTKHVFIFSLVLSALLLQACGNTDAAIATGIAQTQQISELETAAAGGNATATNTPLPPTESGPTSTATIELSPTSSTPYVSVSIDTHCRSGPRVDYALLTTILAGEQVIVLATYPYGDYVVVQRPGGSGSCWLWLEYADRTDFSGYNLPVATQPPTSTPTKTPTPTYTPTPSYTPSPTP